MTIEKLRLRASSLPMAFRCPGSVRRGEIDINESSEASDLGTAAHEALARLIDTGHIDWESVPALAKRHGVDERELRALLALGSKLWASVKESFPMASTEVEFVYDDGA